MEQVERNKQQSLSIPVGFELKVTTPGIAGSNTSQNECIGHSTQPLEACHIKDFQFNVPTQLSDPVSVFSLIEYHFTKSINAVALANDQNTVQITYGQLSQYSFNLALKLFTYQSHTDNEILPILVNMDGSIHMVVVIMAALWANISILPVSSAAYSSSLIHQDKDTIPPIKSSMISIVTLHEKSVIHVAPTSDYTNHGNDDAHPDKSCPYKPFLPKKIDCALIFDLAEPPYTMTHYELAEAVVAGQALQEYSKPMHSELYLKPDKAIVHLLSTLSLGQTLTVLDPFSHAKPLEDTVDQTHYINHPHRLGLLKSKQHIPNSTFYAQSSCNLLSEMDLVSLENVNLENHQLVPNLNSESMVELPIDTSPKLPAEVKKMYSDILGVDMNSLKRDDSFVSIGGDSISAIKIAAMARKAGKKLTSSQVISCKSLSRLEDMVSGLGIGELCAQIDPPASISLEAIDEIRKIHLPRLGLGDRHADIFPCSDLQAAMVTSTLRDRREYLYQFVFKSKQSLNIDSLRFALLQAVKVRDILRTTFVATAAAGVCQIVQPEVHSANVSITSDDIQTFLSKDRCRGFTLEDLNWYRLTVTTDPNTEKAHVVFTIHHALFDGWSMPLIMSDLYAGYYGSQVIQRPLYRSFIDYVYAQDMAKAKKFWSTYLQNVMPCQPLEFWNKAIESTRNVVIHSDCPFTVEHLQHLAQQAEITVAVLLKTAWAATLRKYVRSNDVLFVQVISGRDIPVADVESMVGLLINTVPCRVKFDDSCHITKILSSLQQDHTELLSFSQTSLSDIKKWSKMTEQECLFNTLFVYENMPIGTEYYPDFELDDSLSSHDTNTEFDMELIIFPKHDTINLTMKHSKRVCTEQSRLILEEFIFTLSSIIKCIADPTSTIDCLWNLSDMQVNQISKYSFGQTIPLPYELVHHGFEYQATLHSDWPAIEAGDQTLTYGQLDYCGNVLASQLISQGINLGSRVAVVMQRCLEFSVSLLAILKTGAVIVPIDSKFPAERIQFIMHDSNVSAVLTTAFQIDTTFVCGLDMLRIINVDLCTLLSEVPMPTLPLLPAVSAASPFIIVYTSGSTGKPKGVPVPHHGAINIIANQSKQVGIHPGARVFQFMAIGFDVCQWEIWGALSFGATLVLRRDECIDDGIQSVSTVFITPTGLSQLGNPHDYPNLKHVVLAGEIVPAGLKQKWSSHVQLSNAYGPTEASIISHLGRLYLDRPVTVGSVLQNTSSYILDSNGRQVPIGTVGEMYIGGIGISEGYINLPKQVSDCFFPDPFSNINGGRMFKTGDFARLAPNGSFEIIGRLDDQIKFKGYRIELDEIAAAMMRYPHVSSAIAILNSTHVVGFVTPSNIDVDKLRDMVSTILPVYMIPAVFVALESMPSNANGKTDKKALAAININVVDEMLNDTEMHLARIWSQVLDVNLSLIQRNTSFFEIGGDSLSVTKVVAACIQSNLEIRVMDVFKLRTLSRLASMIAMHACQSVAHSAPIRQTWNFPRKIRIACIHGIASCATHMEFQLSTVQNYFGDHVEFIYINGPCKVDSSPLSEYYSDESWYSWLPEYDHSIGSVETAAGYIINELDNIGPVDGLLGFSQGAIMVCAMDQLSLSGQIARLWRFSILCSGILPSDYQATGKHLSVPNMHIYSYQETSNELQRVDQLYTTSNQVYLKHDAGHDIPRDSKSALDIAKGIAQLAELTIDATQL
ncbi:hypothetical protein BDV3_005439 [Batrachochytrium dendrobatidis]